MAGKAISSHSRAENRQLRPARCARCRKRLVDGEGCYRDRALTCDRCASPPVTGSDSRRAGTRSEDHERG